MRDRRNLNIDRLKANIAGIDWTEVLNTQDINLAYHNFESIIKNFLEQ